MVLRRLSGETANTAPVLTLITQFGGGKTHTLAALYHLANAGPAAAELPGIGELLKSANLAVAPEARVGVSPSGDTEKGCRRPPSIIGRGDRDQAGRSQTGRCGVRARR
jgi:hypothetical protein